MSVALTAYQIASLKLDLDWPALDASVIQAEYDQAQLTGVEVSAYDPYIRLVFIRRLMMAAAKGVDSRVNDVEFKLSQRGSALLKMYNFWLGEYDKALDTGGGVMFGSIRRKPVWVNEFPNEL